MITRNSCKNSTNLEIATGCNLFSQITRGVVPAVVMEIRSLRVGSYLLLVCFSTRMSVAVGISFSDVPGPSLQQELNSFLEKLNLIMVAFTANGYGWCNGLNPLHVIVNAFDSPRTPREIRPTGNEGANQR